MRWTKQERQLVLSLAGNSLAKEIVNELVSMGFKERTPDAIRGIIRRGVKKHKPRNGPKTDDVIPKIEMTDKFQEALIDMAKIRDEALHGITKYSKTIGKPKKISKKILSLSDLHIPFYNEEVIIDAIKKHGNADELVLNGDLLELHAVSRWPKNKEIVLRHEYQIAIKWIMRLAEIFPKITLTRGNHEDRLQSYFQSNVDPGVSFLTAPDILDRLANGYDFDEYGGLKKMHNLPNVHYQKGSLGWFTVIGKCIFAHPSGGSGIPMRTAIKTAEYFLTRGHKFDAVICAHTHKMGSLIWNNKLLIEQGCCCVPLEYEATSKMTYRPSAFGYSVIYQDDKGNVDFDKSGPVYYGTGSLIPNDIKTIE